MEYLGNWKNFEIADKFRTLENWKVLKKKINLFESICFLDSENFCKGCRKNGKILKKMEQFFVKI